MPIYVATGGLRVKGCAGVVVKYIYAVKFLVNEVAYVCAKAADEGKIERVYIKSILVNDVQGSYYTIVYKDTTNRVWLESELCTAAEASALATAYLEDQISRLQDEPCVT